jgi:hypothetical protein
MKFMVVYNDAQRTLTIHSVECAERDRSKGIGVRAPSRAMVLARTAEYCRRFGLPSARVCPKCIGG